MIIDKIKKVTKATVSYNGLMLYEVAKQLGEHNEAFRRCYLRCAHYKIKLSDFTVFSS